MTVRTFFPPLHFTATIVKLHTRLLQAIDITGSLVVNCNYITEVTEVCYSGKIVDVYSGARGVSSTIPVQLP